MSVTHSLPALRRHLTRAGAAAAAFVARIARRDDGASMAEYALLVAVIALVALAGAKMLGATLGAGAFVAAARIANP